MCKKIWIINEYAGTPKYGMTYRHFYIARELVKKGCEVTIISAAYSHFLTQLPKISGKFTSEMIDGVNYFWVKVVKYPKSFCKRRVLKWFDFMFSLFRLPIKTMQKPDVILVSPTAPFSILPAWFWAKKFYSKLIFEVRDIWPLTLIELGGYSPSHPFVKFMGLFEKFALIKSDFVISNLPNYNLHIKELGINRNFEYLPNGISIEELVDIEPISEDLKSKIPKNKFIVGYTGKFGISNAVDDLIAAIGKLKNYNDIFFVLVGNGQEKEKLKESCSDLNNIIFFDSINKKQIQSMLEYFDVCYIGWKKKKIYEFGVSPNKIFDYMYSGKPILHAINTKNDIVSLANCGLTVEAENHEAIARGIIELYKMSPQKRNSLGQNGKKYVLKYHNYEYLTDKLLSLIPQTEEASVILIQN